MPFSNDASNAAMGMATLAEADKAARGGKRSRGFVANLHGCSEDIDMYPRHARAPLPPLDTGGGITETMYPRAKHFPLGATGEFILIVF